MIESQHKKDWRLGILGIFFSIIFLIFFIMYFHYVSIGSWIAQENYTNKGEWMKQLGLFVATLMGFYLMSEECFNLLDYLPELCSKSQNKHKGEKSQN